MRDLNDVPEYSGHGTPPKGKFVRVDKLKQKLSDTDWVTIDVRDGEKGPLKMKLAVFHVLARTERGKHGSGESEWLIVVERPKGTGVQCDYYLSNADDGTTDDEFARVILASHRVEDCFRRAKSECGIAQYEVQSWIGSHHHVTLCLLATWVLTKETMRGKKRLAITDRADESAADRRTVAPPCDANLSRLDRMEHRTTIPPPRTRLLLPLKIKKHPPAKKV